MKQLILLRHGEAQPHRPGLADFDRTLTERGRTEALDAADRLRQAPVRIDALLASPALRAKETALIVAARLDFDRELLFDLTLYQGEAESLLPPLQRCAAAINTLLMVGHNPSLSALACRFAAQLVSDKARGTGGARQLEARLRAPPLDLPTAGMCCVQFEAELWSELQPGAVTAVELLR